MGALETNTTLIYGVHLRESANDGSDFTNAAADYRILFLGEDGDLHTKDSGGSVNTIGGGGGTGQGLVDFASTRYTAGDITCDADSVWEALGISDLTITAASGDWVEVGLSLTCPNTTAVSLNFDAVSIVSAAPVNSIATGAAPSDSNNGVSAWRIATGEALSVGGSILYQLQAGDISGGTVTLQMRDRPASSTNRVVSATTASPIHFWAKNLGPSM